MVSSQARDDLVVISRPQEIKRGPAPFLAGCSRQVSAGVAFCRWISEAQMAWTIMVFGWPGTGKSVFPKVLAHSLNRGNGHFAYVYIRSAALTARLTVDQVRERLSEVDDFVKQNQGPKLVVFDEIDALTPSRTENPTLLRLSTWAMDFLDIEELKLRRSVVLGVTNNPERIEPAVRDRLHSCIYFQLPDETTIAHILLDLGLPKHDEVAKRLMETIGIDGARPTGRGVANAARILLKMGVDSLATMEAHAIADLTQPYCGFVDAEEANIFDFRNRARIRQSDRFLNRWATEPREKVTTKGRAK